MKQALKLMTAMMVSNLSLISAADPKAHPMSRSLSRLSIDSDLIFFGEVNRNGVMPYLTLPTATGILAIQAHGNTNDNDAIQVFLSQIITQLARLHTKTTRTMLNELKPFHDQINAQTTALAVTWYSLKSDKGCAVHISKKGIDSDELTAKTNILHICGAHQDINFWNGPGKQTLLKNVSKDASQQAEQIQKSIEAKTKEPTSFILIDCQKLRKEHENTDQKSCCTVS